MFILLTILLHLLTFATSYDRGTHNTNTPNEKFVFRGDSEYIFYAKKASWNEASTICRATRSRLAVVHTKERAEFLAQALSQTIVGFEDVWIGGRFKGGQWLWTSTGSVIPAPENGYPPWVKYPTARGKRCLALDRKNHWEPIFVEISCYLYRPFICEQSLSENPTIPLPPTVVQIGPSQFFLYHARVTWDEAMAYCKEMGSRLAVILELNTTQTLVGVMKRSRPAYENVWIGGVRDSEGWFWASTEKRIASETDLDGYPPWKYGEARNDKKNCIILDHHHCSNPLHIDSRLIHYCEQGVFIEEECSVKKDFLCEKSDISFGDSPGVDFIISTVYVMYLQKRTWVEAKFICEQSNWTLAVPKSKHEWDYIVYMMHELSMEVDHLWLGGIWQNDKWLWLSEDAITLPSENSTWPPWCRRWPIYEEGEDCLNLDRDAHNLALIYGFNCSAKQEFVCQITSNNSINLPDQETTVILSDGKLKHLEASHACALNNSELIVVNSMSAAKQLALTLPHDELVWIGGKQEDSVWRWMRTREIIPDVPQADGYPPWQDLQTINSSHVCLAMSSGFRKVPQFWERDCSEKYRYVCRLALNNVPQADITDTYKNETYYFYKKNVTWDEAVAICELTNKQLVEARSTPLINFLMGIMKDDPPIWINGRRIMEGAWAWHSNSEGIPPTATNGFPPWGKNTMNSSIHNCLMLNRENPNFEADECKALHGFVCVNKKSLPQVPINIKDISVEVPRLIADIQKAKQACKDTGMEVLDLTKSISFINKFMTSQKIKAIWLDFMRNETGGKWVNIETHEELKSELPFVEGKSEYSTTSCLTLELVKNELQLISADCNDFKHMMCYKPDPPPQEQSKVVNSTITLVTKLPENSFNTTNVLCSDKGGEMIDKTLIPAAIEFFKTLHDAYKTFWIGASYSNNAWMWSDGTPVELKNLPSPFIENENENVHYCLYYNRAEDTLLADDCSKKHSTMCQQVRWTCPQLVEENAIVFKPKECSKGEMEEGQICNVYCSTKTLFGPERLVCTKGVWTFRGKQPKKIACLSESDMGAYLHNTIFNLTKSSVIFMIDNGADSKLLGSSIAIAESIADSLILSNVRTAAVEVYSNKGIITEPDENSNCYIKNTFRCVRERGPKLDHSPANYYEAFKTVEKHMKSRRMHISQLLIVFFAIRPDEGSFNRSLIISNMKDKGTAIVVVSLGRNVNPNLCQEIATMDGQMLQYYALRDYQSAKRFRNALQQRSIIKSSADCPRYDRC